MFTSKKKLILILALLMVLIVTSTAAAFFTLTYWLNTPLDHNRFLASAAQQTPQEKVVKLAHGSSLHATAHLLFKNGFIHYPKLWVLYAKATSQTNIKAGEYVFDQSYSPKAVLTKLIKGDVVYRSVRFIEGQTFKQVYRVLQNQEGLQQKLTSANTPAVIEQLNLSVEHLEGWFFPDTYYYSLGETDISILKRAHTKMQNVLTTQWQNRQANLPYNTPYDALIMASIIDKETGAAFERADIAGVFVNRLNKGMRLQTDPTVIYGMGDAYKGNITRKNLKTPTPYNTYTQHGLPPTPIAMPSEMAIHAALNPNQHDYIFFVGKGDGTHQFSVTLAEHNRAVRQYQLKRVKNYRSTIKQ